MGEENMLKKKKNVLRKKLIDAILNEGPLKYYQEMSVKDLPDVIVEAVAKDRKYLNKLSDNELIRRYGEIRYEQGYSEICHDGPEI
jgi:hypothetical protein